MGAMKNSCGFHLSGLWALYIVTISLLFLFCEPCNYMISERSNSRYEKIDYDGFSLNIDIYKFSGYQVQIIFEVFPIDSISIVPERLKVIYKGSQIAYRVGYNSKEIIDQESIILSKKKEQIFFAVDLKSGVLTGDKITIFGEGLFKRGDKYFDLDSLTFIMPKARGIYREGS